MVPRKIPTTMSFVKSTAGIFSAGACSFQSAFHSAAVRTVTCLAVCCSLMSPFATVENAGV